MNFQYYGVKQRLEVNFYNRKLIDFFFSFPFNFSFHPHRCSIPTSPGLRFCFKLFLSNMFKLKMHCSNHIRYIMTKISILHRLIVLYSD